ncbi:MAG TPA: ATP-binding cassette domain-containing protein, partial [Methanomicrobiales archaeon]|nr:ATP-binding cassette domain-containing protein [Methanomicrobiales archaeon]
MMLLTRIRHRSLDIPRLEIGKGMTALMGPNGSGKTTLLEICAGIAIPEQGTVSLEGLSPRECTVGWVGEYPDRNMLFERVYDEIASPLQFAHVSCQRTHEEATKVAEEVGIAYLLKRNPRHLSGGEKVLVGLAAAIIHR